MLGLRHQYKAPDLMFGKCLSQTAITPSRKKIQQLGTVQLKLQCERTREEQSTESSRDQRYCANYYGFDIMNASLEVYTARGHVDGSCQLRMHMMIVIGGFRGTLLMTVLHWVPNEGSTVFSSSSKLSCISTD
jgi:hypothetical protein